MGKRKKNSKLVNKNKTKLVRIDASLHYHLRLEAAKRSTTIRDLVEEGLAEVLGAKND